MYSATAIHAELLLEKIDNFNFKNLPLVNHTAITYFVLSLSLQPSTAKMNKTKWCLCTCRAEPFERKKKTT